MTVFDIAYSLNASDKIEADTYEEANEKLKAKLKSEGIDLENKFTYEEYDVVEEEK